MDIMYDVIIIGGGAMGISASYYLSKKGLKTLLFDSFTPPHVYGSHTPKEHLFRMAYGEGSIYVPLLMKSKELWEELQLQTKEVIYKKTGVLSFGLKNSKFYKNSKESAKLYNINIEEFDNGLEINDKWKGLRLDEEIAGIYEPNAGFLHAHNIIESYKQLSAGNGCQLNMNETVQNIYQTVNKSVIIVTSKAVYHSKKIVVCNGFFINNLLRDLGINLNLKAVHSEIDYYRANEEYYNSEIFPGIFGKLSDDSTFHAYPSFNQRGVKSSASIKNKEKLNNILPFTGDSLEKKSVSVINLTPDGNFIIDFLPNNHNIVIATGFSGHGFKFASSIGNIISEMVIDEKTGADISAFSINRPKILRKI